jgi:phosphoserine aminotransferase
MNLWLWLKNYCRCLDGYEVLFLQGGASSQFSMVPYNLLPEGGKACFLDTGVWSSKAIIEAAKFGKYKYCSKFERQKL